MTDLVGTHPQNRESRATWSYRHVSAIRRATQFAVVLFFLLLPFLFGRGLLDIHGSLYAMDLWGFLVVDPVFAIQKWILGENSVMLVLGAAVPLLIALVLGPVFCGWMCPFGLLTELGARLRLRGSRPGSRVRPPWKGRFLILVGVFVVGTVVHYPLATRLSMPGSLTLASDAVLTSGMVLLELWIVVGVLLLDLLFPRFWCNRICMQGALLALVRTPKTLRIHLDDSRCLQDDCAGECHASCPIGVDPRTVGHPTGCTNCGVCLSACARQGGSLSFRFGRKN
jgi:ferredoxin-type protein NapH